MHRAAPRPARRWRRMRLYAESLNLRATLENPSRFDLARSLYATVAHPFRCSNASRRRARVVATPTAHSSVSRRASRDHDRDACAGIASGKSSRESAHGANGQASRRVGLSNSYSVQQRAPVKRSECGFSGFCQCFIESSPAQSSFDRLPRSAQRVTGVTSFRWSTHLSVTHHSTDDP